MGELSGYMTLGVDHVPKKFGAGFFLYAAAGPLVERYPGVRLQAGLFGTWMFARFAEGRTLVLHQLRTCALEAITEPVRRWFVGGDVAPGAIDSSASHVQRFNGGGSTWRIFADRAPHEGRREVDSARCGTVEVHDDATLGYRWNDEFVRSVTDGNGRGLRRPEHYRIDEREGWRRRWVPVTAAEFPAETGLHELAFETQPRRDPEAYVAADAPDSPFLAPEPVASPFELTLGDGSALTCARYRFTDQLAMLDADLSDAEGEKAQRRVELIHRHRTEDREYPPPTTTGELASIDPALIVTTPPGFGIGHVPIAPRQEWRCELGMRVGGSTLEWIVEDAGAWRSSPRSPERRHTEASARSSGSRYGRFGR